MSRLDPPAEGVLGLKYTGCLSSLQVEKNYTTEVGVSSLAYFLVRTDTEKSFVKNGLNVE